MILWYVAVGSGVGGVARFVLGGWLQGRAGGTFPVSTLVINLAGSLLLGFLVRYALEGPAVSPNVRAMLTAGFCGGFTTFSTFSYEAVRLLEDGEYGRAALYVASSAGLALLATAGGVMLARELAALRRAL